MSAKDNAATMQHSAFQANEATDQRQPAPAYQFPMASKSLGSEKKSNGGADRPNKSSSGGQSERANSFGGYYLNVAQKGKLMLPTALWILLILAGVCFLSLLASLNKTMGALDELVDELEARDSHDRPATREWPPAHHSFDLAKNPKTRPFESSPESLEESSDFFRMPSWLSLEPTSKQLRHGDVKDDADEVVGVQIVSGFMPPQEESRIGHDGDSVVKMFGSLFGSQLDGIMRSPEGPIAMKGDQVDDQANWRNDASGLVTANIDTINININNQPAEKKKASKSTSQMTKKSKQKKKTEAEASDSSREEQINRLEVSVNDLVDKLLEGTREGDPQRFGLPKHADFAVHKRPQHKFELSPTVTESPISLADLLLMSGPMSEHADSNQMSPLHLTPPPIRPTWDVPRGPQMLIFSTDNMPSSMASKAPSQPKDPFESILPVGSPYEMDVDPLFSIDKQTADKTTAGDNSTPSSHFSLESSVSPTMETQTTSGDQLTTASNKPDASNELKQMELLGTTAVPTSTTTGKTEVADFSTNLPNADENWAQSFMKSILASDLSGTTADTTTQKSTDGQQSSTLAPTTISTSSERSKVEQDDGDTMQSLLDDLSDQLIAMPQSSGQSQPMHTTEPNKSSPSSSSSSRDREPKATDTTPIEATKLPTVEIPSTGFLNSILDFFRRDTFDPITGKVPVATRSSTTPTPEPSKPQDMDVVRVDSTSSSPFREILNTFETRHKPLIELKERIFPSERTTLKPARELEPTPSQKHFPEPANKNATSTEAPIKTTPSIKESSVMKVDETSSNKTQTKTLLQKADDFLEKNIMSFRNLF